MFDPPIGCTHSPPHFVLFTPDTRVLGTERSNIVPLVFLRIFLDLVTFLTQKNHNENPNKCCNAPYEFNPALNIGLLNLVMRIIEMGGCVLL